MPLASFLVGKTGLSTASSDFQVGVNSLPPLSAPADSLAAQAEHEGHTFLVRAWDTLRRSARNVDTRPQPDATDHTEMTSTSHE